MYWSTRLTGSIPSTPNSPTGLTEPPVRAARAAPAVRAARKRSVPAASSAAWLGSPPRPLAPAALPAPASSVHEARFVVDPRRAQDLALQPLNVSRIDGAVCALRRKSVFTGRPTATTSSTRCRPASKELNSVWPAA